MTRLRVLFIWPLLIGILTTAPALAAWPSDWPFLKADEGWFFYKDQLPPRATQPPVALPAEPESQDAPPLTPLSPEEIPWPPVAPPEPQSTGPHTQDQESATETLTFTVVEPELQVAPIAGPKLEAWLLAISDTDLERLVLTAPAGALRAWMPILMDQALTVLDRVAVRKYLLAQRETMRRSDRFSKLWQEVVWTDPTFDRPGTLPTGALAQAIHEEEQAATRKTTVAELQPRVSLLLVVGPRCKACEAQWKVLRNWSVSGGLPVRAIAKELVTLADSSIALSYPRVIAQLDIKELPSLYLVEPTSGYLTRLGSGLLSEEEIVTRLLRLVPTDDGAPKGGPPDGRPSPRTGLLRARAPK